MKIEVSESTLKTIIYSLENYLNKCLDIDEDAAEMIVVAKALGELQGTYKALKDNENRETRWKIQNELLLTWALIILLEHLKSHITTRNVTQ